MEELVTATPGFAKDENGRYHFQGSHSQGQFVVDGQTISDQTGVTFSNSIDPGIAQSMEVIYGNVPAEYGDKVGTVVNMVDEVGSLAPLERRRLRGRGPLLDLRGRPHRRRAAPGASACSRRSTARGRTASSTP